MSIKDFTILAKLGTYITINQDKALIHLSIRWRDWLIISNMPSKKSNSITSRKNSFKMLSIRFEYLPPSITRILLGIKRLS